MRQKQPQRLLLLPCSFLAYGESKPIATSRMSPRLAFSKKSASSEGILRHFMVLPNLGNTPRDVYCYAKISEPAVSLTA